MSDDSPLEVRIDKYLWATRLFKTRALAADACNGGKVKVNGDAAKPARHVKIGELIEARTPGGPRVIRVERLSDHRGPAAVAATLFEDLTPPEELEAIPQRDRGAGRPTGRDRRAVRRLRGV
ncbi:MAG: RNA-binding S4 domain-containing protein [Deltaproteobacteria bacterium]|nr:RNA-binding S4 domain-containing protein [Deltaproteobacteria bacterium]